MKKFLIILWNVITVLMIIVLFVGIKYFNFISLNSGLIALAVILLIYFSIPIYFVQGENDFNTVTSVVAEYYNKIDTPNKDLLILKKCGHDPQWDYPKEFHSFLLSKYALITKPYH